MVLRATWRSSDPELQKNFRFRTRLGRGVGWLKVDRGEGELAVHLQIETGTGYVEPERLSALGALVFAEIPEIAGRETAMRVSPLPERWSEVTDRVSSYLRRLGLTARIEGRVMKFTDDADSPTVLIRRVTIALFSMDAYTLERSLSETREPIRRLALKHFDSGADEILSLLDEESGGRRLRKLLTEPHASGESERRRDAIASALRKLPVRKLVQFYCGNGAVLRQQSQSMKLERLVGVEPAATVLQRAQARCGSMAEIHHGSLLEPPEGLPTDSAALLVEALPLASDARLARAAAVLFSDLGFEFVLCIERTRWSSSALREWASSTASAYGYLVASWQIGSDSAVLFRRDRPSSKPESIPAKVSPEIDTGIGRRVRVEAAQWRTTVDSFSRWTVDPRWLLYLPPGMCSRQSAEVSGPLEHPSAAFDYYAKEGISKVVVQLKHMGSRAIAVVCRDEAAAEKRFGVAARGCIYTRTGRPFLKDSTEVLDALRDGLGRARFWERFETDWVCLDGELLPWTLKAEHLLQETHGEMLLCGEAELKELNAAFKKLAPEELPYLRRREDCFRKYRRLYEQYQSVEKSVRFAPFHLIATEGRSYFNQNHQWHMQTLGALARSGEIFLNTPFRVVRLGDKDDIASCVKWWEGLSISGAEGVVVKPLYFVPRGRRGLAQPALKCRGEEHLRLVYGPEYDLPEDRLNLANRGALDRRREKHRRVLKQFALSIQGVERFVARDSIERIQECVRSVAALESREI